MPVTISGDGTVTGIAVGGLPNGIVNANTLANNAVTSGSIAANAVTSGSIAANAITSGKLASGVGGKILQVKTAENATETHSTNASIDILTCSITPTATSSNVYIQMVWWLGGETNPNGGFRLTRAGTPVGATSGQYSSTNTFHSCDDYPLSVHAMLPFSWNYLDTGISTTSATEYKLLTDSFTAIYLNRNTQGSATGRSTMILMEVAA